MENKGSYMWAESRMREGKTVRRRAWPTPKVAYHDIEGDGVPDVYFANMPDFMKEYELFKKNIRVDLNGAEPGGIVSGNYINQADSLAWDWEEI